LLRFTHFITFLLWSLISLGQYELLDTVRSALKADPTLTLALNNRTTFINAHDVTLYGVEAGYSYDSKVRLYLGLYGLSNKNKKWLLDDPRFEADSVLRSSSVGNISAGVEVTLIKQKRFKLRMPLQIGLGSVRTRYSFVDQKHIDEHAFMMPVEIGTNASFKLFRFLYLGGGVGYRLQLGNNKVLRMSSPFYSLGLGIPLEDLYYYLIDTY
jgi:hypothetical protein